MMKVQAIIPTAGLSTRMKKEVPKPFLEILGKPIIVHTLESFDQCSLIESIVLVVHENMVKEFEDLVSQHSLKKVVKIIIGGLTRSDSVSNALKVIDSDTDYIVIHDGVRPVISSQDVSEIIKRSKENDGLVMAVPVKSTIKVADKETKIVKKTLDRSELWEIQTPQIFKKDVLIEAHAARGDFDATDDAVLVERIGKKVKIFEGNYQNLKVTTQEDLVLAETFLKQLK